VLYYGHIIFGCEHESVEHLTCVFNVFVLCQLFNEINARKLNGEFNVFSRLFTNIVFVGVMIFTNVMQFIIVQYGGHFTSTAPLSLNQWLLCFGIASLGIVVGFMVKLLPAPVEKVSRPEEPVAAESQSWDKIRQLHKASTFISTIRRHRQVMSVVAKKAGTP